MTTTRAHAHARNDKRGLQVVRSYSAAKSMITLRKARAPSNRPGRKVARASNSDRS